MSAHQLIATSAAGLEAVVVRELQALGFADAKTRSTGRVVFAGDDAAIATANIQLRCAERVLLEVGNFEAADFDQLYEQTYDLPWDAWLRPDSSFPVNGRSVKSQLTSVPAVQRTVKKAIVEKLRAVFGCETLPEDGPEVGIEISLLENQASLTLDTSGVGLHKRGYRRLTAAAPLRETLSAALVDLSFWQPDRPLLDPFCGSGTIAIEAAMIGRKIAPGVYRTFAAQQWDFIEQSVWQEAREHAAEQAVAELPERIIATDIDADVLSYARFHAEKVGVADDIHFQQADFADLKSSREYGCLITNPPYGQRVGEQEAVEELYRQMPLVLRNLPTWSHYILTSYQGFETLLERKADRRRKLYNAQIECTYYQFYGPRPPHGMQPPPKLDTKDRSDTTKLTPAPAAVPLPAITVQPAFGSLSDKSHEQAEIFANRLRKTARHLRRWPTRRGITCYRLYDRDVPEVPLVVDRYEDHLHLAEYERPHERSAAEHANWLDLMVKTAAITLEVPRNQVFLKRRDRQRGVQQYEKAADERHRLLVEEADLKFEVNLSDYIDTGLFLDHRITRAMFAEQAKDKEVLNLFCYTGAFTVYAAAAGAQSTTSVDLSNTYLDWAQRNLEHNELEGPQHRLVRSDVLEFLESQPDEPTFDLAIVDPPTFSNSKSTESVWDIQQDHVALLTQVLKLIRPGGCVFFSTNSRRFKLDAAAVEGTELREITKQTMPEDFRNKRIHRCWSMVKIPTNVDD
jgi:23S rRNA (guanine2445-N2)-methyltransferase / 23S rRNA (guanine2069-N7)-methyltransferase